MTKEDFLNKWIDALPLNSKDSDRKEMEYDLEQLHQKQLPTDEEIEEEAEGRWEAIIDGIEGTDTIQFENGRALGFKEGAEWMREQLP